MCNTKISARQNKKSKAAGPQQLQLAAAPLIACCGAPAEEEASQTKKHIKQLQDKGQGCQTVQSQLACLNSKEALSQLLPLACLRAAAAALAADKASSWACQLPAAPFTCVGCRDLASNAEHGLLLQPKQGRATRARHWSLEEG